MDRHLLPAIAISQSCPLAGADLRLANLGDALLIGANLDKANLTDVIGADFTGAVNVSPKYR